MVCLIQSHMSTCVLSTSDNHLCPGGTWKRSGARYLLVAANWLGSISRRNHEQPSFCRRGLLVPLPLILKRQPAWQVSKYLLMDSGRAGNFFPRGMGSRDYSRQMHFELLCQSSAIFTMNYSTYKLGTEEAGQPEYTKQTR